MSPSDDAPFLAESLPEVDDADVLHGEILEGDDTGIPARMTDTLPSVLPVLVSGEGPIFPGMMSPIPLADDRARHSYKAAGSHVGVIAARPHGYRPGEATEVDRLFHVGCVAQVVKPVQMDEDTGGVLVAGVKRMQVRRYIRTDTALLAELEYPDERVHDGRELAALFQRLREGLKELATTSPDLPEAVGDIVDKIAQPGALADFVAANLESDPVGRQDILADLELCSRLRRALTVVEQRLDIARLGAKIQGEIRSKIETHQRQHYLREQMTAIRRELGEEVDQHESDRDQYLTKIAEAAMPQEAEERARKELDRLLMLSAEASEYHVIRNYLDWLVELPWSKASEEKIDVKRARKILDEDHHGLDEVKARILEFLAVRKLRADAQGAILCLVGPPGVGKTSLGQSIARATGREYVRVALGGMRDEAEIKGHRRTYVGAMPGKLIQSLKRAGTRNPVFVLDELDKLGADWRGDPSSALLEVLDPAQNNAFSDHYIDLPFDLSQVMFIATANMESQIPGPLRDRMEVIHISGYIPAEKKQIGRKYLLPRQIEAHGLASRHLKVPARAMTAIIDGYTREAGVRELERMLGRACRKVAAEVATLDDPAEAGTVTLDPDNLREFLGPKRYIHDVIERSRRPGVVTGLAWTPFGGEVLFIEATIMPGNGRLQLTGKLGDVMNESARIAWTLIKAHAEEFGIPRKLLTGSDVHLHVPAGAVSKDGPSAGVAMVSALLSLLWKGKGKAPRARVAMTGEITLRGRILPVGGIRDKVIGAKRAGIKTVVLPGDNRPDVEEIPPHVVRGLKFVFVDEIEEAVEVVLGKL